MNIPILNHADLIIILQICGSEKRWIHRWRVGADEKPKSVKKHLFDAKMENLGKNSTVFLKTSPTTITVCNGKKAITKIESNRGKIISMALHDDAKKVIYMTDTSSIVMHDMVTEQSTHLSKLSSVDSYIDTLRLNDNYMVLCTENNKLQVSFAQYLIII